MRKRKKKEGVYLDKQCGKNWQCSYSDASGKRIRRTTGTTNKREAINLRNKWATEEWDKKVRGIEPDRSFEQVAYLYLQGTAGVKRSCETDRSRMKALYEFFPDGLLMNTLCS